MSAPSHAPNGLHDAAHQGATAHAPVALLDILDKLPSDEEAAAAMANPASSKFAASMESLRQEYRRMKRFLEETQKETGQLREADQLTIAKGYGALRAATAVGREKEPQLLPLDDEIEDERPARKKRKTSENTSIPSTSTAHTGETGRFKVTAVGRFSDVMNGKFTKQLVQALGATWYRGKRPLRSSRSRSKATNGTTMFTHPNPTGAFDFEIDWRTGKSSGGFYEEKNKRKPSVWGGARKLFKGSQRIFIAGYAGFCSDKPTMIWALEDSDADVIYIRSNEHNEATCWVYHAPNLVEQLKDNAPRTGPLVADMETGDGARLLISMAKRLDEGCRYDMFRKVDAKGNVSFVPGEGGEGGEAAIDNRPDFDIEDSSTIKDSPTGLHQRFVLRASDLARATNRAESSKAAQTVTSRASQAETSSAARAGSSRPVRAAASKAPGVWSSALNTTSDWQRPKKLMRRDQCPWDDEKCFDAIAKGKMEPRMTGEAADDWCVRHGNEGGHLEDLDDCPGMHWDKCKKMWMDEGATALGKHLREDHDMRD